MDRRSSVHGVVAVVFGLLVATACSSGSPAGNPGACADDGCAGDGGSGGTGGAGGMGGTGGLGGAGGVAGSGGFGGTGGDGGHGGVGGTGGSGGSGGTGGVGGTGGTVPVTCGDGSIDAGEACDDGNREPGDGCSAACTVEPECRWDLDCGDGEVCSARSGQRGTCVPAPGACATNLDCPGVDPTRCLDAEACLCDTSPGPAGVCRRRFPTCQPCTTDAECGDAETFTHAGRCVEHDVVHDEFIRREAVCLRLPGPYGDCPPDQTVGPSGLCEPEFGACPAGSYCESDADCSGHRPCERTTGRCLTVSCVAPWPWSDGDNTCGDKRACVPSPQRLDPSFLENCSSAAFWGGMYGRCSTACVDDADCADVVDPWNRPYVCVRSGNVNGCRPPGCLHDSECPAPSGTVGAYCDAATTACVEGPCRLGFDPRYGCGVEVPYDDCAPGHECRPAASGDALGTCVAIDP